MITDLSPQQWAQIPALRESIYQMCVAPRNEELERQAVKLLYENAGLASPAKILWCKSPLEGILTLAVIKNNSLGVSLGDSLRDNLGDNLWANLSSYYEKAWLGLFLGGEFAGLSLPELEMYQSIVQHLDFIFPFKDLCIICDRPTFTGWHDDGGIHCEDGPAVQYADGYALWALEGYLVPKELILEPENQRLEDIRNEENEEIRRIRISRYGWGRYLQEMGAKVLDLSMPKYGGMESLMKCGDYTILCTYDPSTGRPYSLEVEPDCQTCEAAQRYLLAPEIAFDGLGIEPSKVKTYPVLRT